jgi:outer membrane protein OmpA-like peptidoglycan-associated protein
MKKLGAALGLLTMAALPSVGLASDQEGWQFEITPYLWAFGVDGEATFNDYNADFSKDWGDIADNIDGGGSALFVGSYNRFVFLLQYDAASIDADDDGFNQRLADDFGSTAKLDSEFDTAIGTAAIGYRFDTFGDHSWVDVMVGVRQTKLESEFKVAYDDTSVTPPVRVTDKFDSDPDVTDTILMLRPSFQLSQRWRFNPTLSYAVDGDSEEHYELSPQIQYQFSDYFALRIGYRSLAYEIEEGSYNPAPGVAPTAVAGPGNNYRKFDGDIAGAVIGIGWTFPKKQEPVAPAPAPAAAPPPPPPKAAAPVDSDGDGVIDANDKCPNTPRGSRVDTHGCECDFSLSLTFEFDSAELHATDKMQLDDLAARLKNANWAIGRVEGHTDSIGSDAYNMALSKRRAEAVVSYLASKGLDRSRATVVGLGESQPVADNATEAGRAQNRRVVIKRTDCN